MNTLSGNLIVCGAGLAAINPLAWLAVLAGVGLALTGN